MKLLSVSNGHGEDAIAVRILQQLQQFPNAPELAALPIVGQGHSYAGANIPIIGRVQTMPSGGFVYMDGRQLARDLRGGLLQLTLSQLKTIRQWAKEGGAILAVGDIVPLLFAWWSGAPYAFVGTAKSEYYLRDEAGWLPRASWWERMEGWSGSDYLPWERWLMSRPQCKAMFPRDRLTTEVLRQWNIPVFDVGNPMMDGLAMTDESKPEVTIAPDTLTIVLIPGSRPPEAYANWQLILQAVAQIVTTFGTKPLQFLAAIAPGLDLQVLQQALTAHHWQFSTPTAEPSHPQFYQNRARLSLLQNHFNQCLHQADFAIAMAGTATEQFVGLGKPAIGIVGKGPQYTYRFAEAQTRLLGPSLTLVKHPTQVAKALQALLNDPDRLQLIADNGRRRMGEPGAAQRMAQHLIDVLA